MDISENHNETESKPSREAEFSTSLWKLDKDWKEQGAASAALNARTLRRKWNVMDGFRFSICLFLGIALGIFLADAGWWHRNNGVVQWITKIPMLYGFLYYPAALLFYCCMSLHLTPTGTAAWDWSPWCVIVYWTTVGLLVGLWTVRRWTRVVQTNS